MRFRYLSLEMSIQLFFSHFCFLVILMLFILVLSVLFLVPIMSLLPSFFYVVFESFYLRIDSYLHVDESSSPFFFFLTHSLSTLLLVVVVLLILLFHSVWVFHPGVSFWSSIGVWKTVNLLKFPWHLWILTIGLSSFDSSSHLQSLYSFFLGLCGFFPRVLLPPYYLDTYNQSTLSLWCKALCIINFLVHLSEFLPCPF